MPQESNYHNSLPSFLYDSPYLPLSTSQASKPSQYMPSKPSLGLVLCSRPLRYMTLTITALYVLLTLSRGFSNSLRYYSGPQCLHKSPIITPSERDVEAETDWSQYAYVQYVTDTEYLCNSLMLFESLYSMDSRADRLMMYPMDFDVEGNGIQGRLLRKARDEYAVKLVAVEVQTNKNAFHRWASSYTKLLAFNQTQYTRLLHLDSDALLFQPMDELFLSPPSPITLPRAYWLAQPVLASHIMLLTPSLETFQRIQTAITTTAGSGTYDMEIINKLFGSSCSILPHRSYALLTGEFRRATHPNYLSLHGDGVMEGEVESVWNSEKVVSRASWVHFSDHPLGKPWEEGETNSRLYEEMKPRCEKVEEDETELGCGDRNIWTGFYEKFWARRIRLCGLAEGEGEG